jgi:hypothetical protein
VYETDRALRLVDTPGHSVVVLGYLGEPLLRIDDRSAAVNVGSPSEPSTGLLKKSQLVGSGTVARDRQRVASGAIGFGALAALAFVATASAFALDANASPGTWIFGADGLVFVALGLGILIRARGICTLVRPSGSGCSLSPSHSRRPRCSSIRSSSRTFRAGRRGLPLRRPSAPALPLPPSEAFPTSRR